MKIINVFPQLIALVLLVCFSGCGKAPVSDQKMVLAKGMIETNKTTQWRNGYVLFSGASSNETAVFFFT